MNEADHMYLEKHSKTGSDLYGCAIRGDWDGYGIELLMSEYDTARERCVITARLGAAGHPARQTSRGRRHHGHETRISDPHVRRPGERMDRGGLCLGSAGGKDLWSEFLNIILTFNKNKTIFAARIAPCCVIGLGNTQSIPCGHCLA